MTIIEIDPQTYQGSIPNGAELICYEKGGDPLDGMVCYGFDEIGAFDDCFKQPAYAFVSDQ